MAGTSHYRVYRERKKFVLVTAETAAEALKQAGEGEALCVRRIMPGRETLLHLQQLVNTASATPQPDPGAAAPAQAAEEAPTASPASEPAAESAAPAEGSALLYPAFLSPHNTLPFAGAEC